MAGFWTGTGGGMVAEPKRQSRWLLYINKIQPWVCKKVTKPSFTVAESSHQFINHVFHYPGKLEWQTVEATLVDPFDPDTAATLMQTHMKNAGYFVPKSYQDGGTQSITKNAALIDVKIDQIDQHAGDIKETWTLVNAWIQEVNFGDLSYDSDDLVETTVKFRYDYAILQQAGDPG